MSDSLAVYRRVMRRETHFSRTLSASIVACTLILLVFASLVLGTWAMNDDDFHASVMTSIMKAFSLFQTSGMKVVVGAALIILAAVLVSFAILPGRRNRHVRLAERVALLIDNKILADTAADRVATRCGIDRSQICVTVGRRSAMTNVIPTSGVPINRNTVSEATAEALSMAGFEMPVKTTVARKGVLS